LDREFRENFEAFYKAAEPVYKEMRNGVETVLDKYAATNFQEFWAVSVETFFEKPLQMKTNEPVLYNSLCDLLNQDPLILQSGSNN
jgi:Mlc titration factor MtfA (ptsG expression regulator)